MGRRDAVSSTRRAPGRRRRARLTRWHRVPASAVLMAVLIMAGSCVLLYPSAANWLAQVEQSRAVNRYLSNVESLGPDGRSAAIAAARTYNRTLTGGAILDPFSNEPAGENTEAGREYTRQLSLGADQIMARLQIPSISVDLPILHGTDDTVLRRGVGHLFGTALPVGGLGTQAVLTGHSGIPASTLLTHLDQVGMGDEFTVEVYGEILTYRVNTIEVVLPTDTDSLRAEPGKDLISLITCTPIGINTHRLVVRGERVPTLSAEISTGTASQAGTPWWGAGIGLAAGTSIAVLLMASYRRRPNKAFSSRRRS